MLFCCQTSYEKAFDRKKIEKELQDYLLNGVKKNTRPLLAYLKDLPLEKDVIGESSDSLSDLEKKYILKTLNKFKWNISRTARALKIDRVTLYSKIKKHKINPPSK